MSRSTRDQPGHFIQTVRGSSHSPVTAFLCLLDFSLVIISSVKDFMDHYGEINFSDIKAHAVTLNAANDGQEQEYKKIYTCLMSLIIPEPRNTVNLK